MDGGIKGSHDINWGAFLNQHKNEAKLERTLGWKPPAIWPPDL